MRLTNSTTRYGSLSIAIHWFMLFLLAAVVMCMELRENYPKGSDVREAFKTWHYMLGLSVFALVWIRVAVRIVGVTPKADSSSPSWQVLLAKLMHGALYVFMLAMPVVGWLILSAEGDAIPFFGLTLPPLIDANKDLVKPLEEIHETAATIGYVLVGLHAAAALFHHYVKRDKTLLRMLPGRDEK